MKLRNALLTTGFAIATTALFAQDAAKQNPNTVPTKSELDNWSVGINAGSMLFYGDIKQYEFAPVTKYNNEWRFGCGATVTRSFNSIFSGQLQFLYGELSGTKRKINRTFEANVLEYSLNGIINLSNLTFSQKAKPRKISFYGLVGFGLTTFKSQLSELNTGKDVGSFGYAASGPGSKRTKEIVIPVGLGIKYKLSPKLDLGLEGTLRNANSDKLDVTVSPTNKNDKYGYTDVTLTYKFGQKADAMEWVNPLDALYADNAAIKSKIEGLTTDSDKDGVADIFDKDNATPDGVKVYGDGTAVDTDGDGVPDSQDADPFTAKGAKVDNKGKESDADGDGVPDSKDQEANTPSGALVNFQGKSIHTTAGTTEVSSTGYLPSIYFASGSAAIQYKYYENLAAIARVLKANPSIKLTIVGNADAKGSDKQNDKIAMKRAEAVAANLSKVYGIESSRLKVESKGKTEILGKTDAVNRRVDFKVSK